MGNRINTLLQTTIPEDNEESIYLAKQTQGEKMQQAPKNTFHQEKPKRTDGLEVVVRSWRRELKGRGVLAIVPGFTSRQV